MRQSGSATMLPLAIVAAVLAAALLSASAMAAFAMARGDWGMGDWGMGRGHMQRMMGGGTNSSNAPVSVGGKTERASIRDYAFAPGNLQIPVGGTVTWTNYDDVPHTATAKDGSWDTGILNKGDTKTLSFDKAGDYTYYCTVHPSMVARLQVQ